MQAYPIKIESLTTQKTIIYFTPKVVSNSSKHTANALKNVGDDMFFLLWCQNLIICERCEILLTCMCFSLFLKVELMSSNLCKATMISALSHKMELKGLDGDQNSIIYLLSSHQLLFLSWQFICCCNPHLGVRLESPLYPFANEIFKDIVCGYFFFFLGDAF